MVVIRVTSGLLVIGLIPEHELIPFPHPILSLTALIGVGHIGFQIDYLLVLYINVRRI